MPARAFAIPLRSSVSVGFGAFLEPFEVRDECREEDKGAVQKQRFQKAIMEVEVET